MSENDDDSTIQDRNALNANAVLPKLYEDVASPAAKEIGKGLKTVAQATNIVLRPVAGLVWGYEKIEDYLINELPQRLSKRGVDETKIVSPELHLAGPLLESLKYTAYQESLREMYLNLLATSMDKEAAEKAHPSFVEIIRQLSPDEAKLLAYFQKFKWYPVIDREWVSDDILRRELCEDINSRFEYICETADIDSPKQYLIYLDNLLRLKILDFDLKFGEIAFSNRESYFFENEFEVRQQNHKSLYVTSLGQQFIEACLDNGDLTNESAEPSCDKPTDD